MLKIKKISKKENYLNIYFKKPLFRWKKLYEKLYQLYEDEENHNFWLLIDKSDKYIIARFILRNKEDILPYVKYGFKEELLDYITNLQEENQKFKNWINVLNKNNHNYKSRNEKAIEYNKQKLEDIKEEIITVTIYDKEYEKYVKEILNNNLNILQGSDKNE